MVATLSVTQTVIYIMRIKLYWKKTLNLNMQLFGKKFEASVTTSKLCIWHFSSQGTSSQGCTSGRTSAVWRPGTIKQRHHQSIGCMHSAVTSYWCVAAQLRRNLVWFGPTSSHPKVPILFSKPPPSSSKRSWSLRTVLAVGMQPKKQLVLVHACCCRPQVVEKSKMLVYASPHLNHPPPVLVSSVSKSTTTSTSIFPQCFWGHPLKLLLLDVFSAPLCLVSTEFVH